MMCSWFVFLGLIGAAFILGAVGAIWALYRLALDTEIERMASRSSELKGRVMK